jgi:hypothetical protein
MPSELEERVVVPFYLAMMSQNVLSVASGEMLAQFVAVGRKTDASEVAMLLRDSWRPQVMGAWYSIFHDDPIVKTAVLEALAGSFGYLTSPPLATVAALTAESEALPAMNIYLARDLEHGWGGAKFVAAAMVYLGQPAINCEPDTEDKASFERMLAVARDLQGSKPPETSLLGLDQTRRHRWSVSRAALSSAPSLR